MSNQNLQQTCNQLATDCISRREAIEALLEKGQCSRRYKLGDIWELNFDEIREAINTVPTVQPDVIRCGECKFYCYDKDHIPYCMQLGYRYGWKSEDFCSMAERREE